MKALTPAERVALLSQSLADDAERQRRAKYRRLGLWAERETATLRKEQARKEEAPPLKASSAEYCYPTFQDPPLARPATPTAPAVVSPPPPAPPRKPQLHGELPQRLAAWQRKDIAKRVQLLRWLHVEYKRLLHRQIMWRYRLIHARYYGLLAEETAEQTTERLLQGGA